MEEEVTDDERPKIISHHHHIKRESSSSSGSDSEIKSDTDLNHPTQGYTVPIKNSDKDSVNKPTKSSLGCAIFWMNFTFGLVHKGYME